MVKRINKLLAVLLSFLLIVSLLQGRSSYVVAEGDPIPPVTYSASQSGKFNVRGIDLDWTKTLTYKGNREYVLDLSLKASHQTVNRNPHIVMSADSYYTVPHSGYYLLQLWGGKGADGQDTVQSKGGQKGAEGLVYGYLWLEKDQTLYTTLGGNGTQSPRGGSGGGPNGDGGGHGDTGSYAVGGGGGYSAVYLFDKNQFESRYLNPDGSLKTISEGDRTSKYILIAGGGGGGGAGNERFFPASGRPDGGSGGRIGGPSATLSGSQYDVPGTFFSGRDGKSSGTSTAYIGRGGTNVPGAIPSTQIGLFAGKEPNDWPGTYNPNYGGGKGGDGNLRGGGGGAGFCGGSGGIMQSLIIGANVGGGGGGSSFIADQVTSDDLPGWMSGYLTEANLCFRGGSFILTYLNDNEEGTGPTQPDFSHLANATLSLDFSDYYDLVNPSIGGVSGSQAGSQVTFQGLTLNGENALTGQLTFRAKDDFPGGNQVPLLASPIAVKTYAGSTEVLDTVIPETEETDQANVPLKFEVKGKSYLSDDPTLTYPLADLYQDDYAGIRNHLGANPLYAFIQSLSPISVWDKSGATEITEAVTPTQTTQYRVKMTVTPRTDAYAEVGPRQELTDFIGLSSITITEAGQIFLGDDLSMFASKELTTEDGVNYILSLKLKEVVKTGVTGLDEIEPVLVNYKDHYDVHGDNTWSYEVPHKGTYRIQAWGANGGRGGTAYLSGVGWPAKARTGYGGAGGAGGYVHAETDLIAGTVLMVELGVNGSAGDDKIDTGNNKKLDCDGGQGGTRTTVSVGETEEMIASGGGGGGGGIAASGTTGLTISSKNGTPGKRTGSFDSVSGDTGLVGQGNGASGGKGSSTQNWLGSVSDDTTIGGEGGYAGSN